MEAYPQPTSEFDHENSTDEPARPELRLIPGQNLDDDLEFAPDTEADGFANCLTEEERMSLVEENIGLVLKIAASFPSRYLEFEDLAQEGYIGLLQASVRFDPGKGVKFQEFASWRIRGAMHDAVRINHPLPRSRQDLAADFVEIENKLAQRLQRTPTLEEIAEAMGKTLDKAREISTWVGDLSAASLESSPPEDLSGDGASGMHEIISDPSVTTEEQIIEGIMDEERDKVINGLRFVTDMERKTLWGIRQDLNLRETGERFGVTESRICQARTSLLKKLIMEFEKEENSHLNPGNV